MIELRAVRQCDRELLWNIDQKYLYEMTKYYDDDMDEAGNYSYGYFEGYFCEEERKAFFIYDDDALVGFAMINPYSYFGAKIDHVMAEFTIFPKYRGHHLAFKAAETIFEHFPGKWEVKYNENNEGARALWNKVTEKYRPRKTPLHASETVLSFFV